MGLCFKFICIISFLDYTYKGCLRVFLCLAYRAAVNTGVHVSFQIMFFSRYMLRSGIAGSHGSSILSFSIVTVLIYIPTNSVEGFPSLHTHQHLLSVDFLMIDFLSGVK